MISVHSLFLWMVGTWELKRAFSNHLHMCGTAQILPNTRDSTELLYKEEGILIFKNGRTLKCYQEYVYRYLNSEIYIFFKGEKPLRLFHKLKFLKNEETDVRKAFAQHLCGKDLYDTEYEFYNNSFSINHQVLGPAKNYVSKTIFERISDS